MILTRNQIIKIYGAILLSMVVWTLWSLLKDPLEHRGDFFSWTGYQFVKPIGVKGQPGYWDGLFYFSSYTFYYCVFISMWLTSFAAYVASGFRIFSVMAWLWSGAVIDYAIHCSLPFGFVFGFPVVYLHFALVVFLIFSIIEIQKHLRYAKYA